MARVKTGLILLCSVLVVSPFAMAADPGTYRPGQPYAATQAVSHAACDSQCKGDAACRGWNFVKANPRQTHGICEFNSLAVDPIQSPIGISANNSSVINYTGSSQIIPAGVRTTRIGSPATPQRVQQTKTIQQTRPTQRTSPQAVSPQRRPQSTTSTPAAPNRDLTIAEQLSQPSTRQVIRQTVQEQRSVRPVAYRHNLDAQSQRYDSRTNIVRTQNGLPPRAPQSQHNSNINSKTYADPRLQHQDSRSQAAPIAAAPATAAQARSNAAHPQRAQRGGLLRALTQSPQTAPVQAPQQAFKAPRESVDVATQKSLYGHLNDDVAIPKPLTAADLNTPVNEPIPTVSSVPVIAVDREAFSGLAGG